MKVNKAWLKQQIENMKSDTRVHELCKCLTKTPDFKYHKPYCPVWKNGRIKELTETLESLKADSEIPCYWKTEIRKVLDGK